MVALVRGQRCSTLSRPPTTVSTQAISRESGPAPRRSAETPWLPPCGQQPQLPQPCDPNTAPASSGRGPRRKSRGLRSTRGGALHTCRQRNSEPRPAVLHQLRRRGSHRQPRRRDRERRQGHSYPRDARQPGRPAHLRPDPSVRNPIKTTASIYRWPLEAREAFFATTARLHAKCVIADRSSLLITSANLTSAGINDNIELGVLIEAGPLPERLSRHLELLIEAGMLEPVSG